MMITPRMKQIFRVLFKESAPVSVRYLAEQVGVSKRTVQREGSEEHTSELQSHLT